MQTMKYISYITVSGKLTFITKADIYLVMHVKLCEDEQVDNLIMLILYYT